MAKQVFTAIVAEVQVRKAIKDWRDKFSKGAEKLNGLGATTLWHLRLAMWGHFEQWKRKDGSDRYWNPFGFSQVRLRQNMIVEINPPAHGMDKNMQGVLARANNGSRWVLHKGRMSIPGAHISEAQFEKASSSQRSPVSFSDGSVIPCHPVGNIDAGPTELQDQIASFVKECNRIRLHYSLGPKVAEQEAAVQAAESNSPEVTGSYYVGAQAPKFAFRRHADVWHALTRELDQMGVRHTNSRVGRWGPDLRTVGDKPVLFEIKVTTTASDLQCAVGQLLLYERLLQGAHQKVIVLPESIKGYLKTVLRDLDLKILVYTQKSKVVNFDLLYLRQLTT
jgi:hypothetical protein